MSSRFTASSPRKAARRFSGATREGKSRPPRRSKTHRTRPADSSGVIDEIVAEPVGGAHTNPAHAAALLDTALVRALAEVAALDVETRLEQRYQKFRKMGSVGLVESWTESVTSYKLQVQNPAFSSLETPSQVTTIPEAMSPFETLSAPVNGRATVMAKTCST